MLIGIAYLFFGTIASVSCPIPAGIFAPSVCLGAIVGKLYGELITQYFTFIEVENIAAYSLVGSAALGACITRTTSVTIIIFELYGQIELLPHLFFGVLASYAIGEIFSKSYYNIMLFKKELPFLPVLLDKLEYERKVKDEFQVVNLKIQQNS